MQKQLTALITELNQTATQLGKLIKRNDLELAIGLQPGHTTKFSLRLGQQPWLKNVDLPVTLDLLTQPTEYRRKLIAQLQIERVKVDRMTEISETIERWQDSVSPEL